MSEDDNFANQPPFYNKVSKITSSYQNRESALRIGMLNKIVANLEANPCTDGTAQCGHNTVCVVDGEDGYDVSFDDNFPFFLNFKLKYKIVNFSVIAKTDSL